VRRRYRGWSRRAVERGRQCRASPPGPGTPAAGA
jgi:hypothetical protein